MLPRVERRAEVELDHLSGSMRTRPRSPLGPAMIVARVASAMSGQSAHLGTQYDERVLKRRGIV